jgi:hypothetical protein
MLEFACESNPIFVDICVSSESSYDILALTETGKLHFWRFSLGAKRSKSALKPVLSANSSSPILSAGFSKDAGSIFVAIGSLTPVFLKRIYSTEAGEFAETISLEIQPTGKQISSTTNVRPQKVFIKLC